MLYAREEGSSKFGSYMQDDHNFTLGDKLFIDNTVFGCPKAKIFPHFPFLMYGR